MLTYFVDDNEKNLTVSNTVTNTHTYTFDWQPDYIAWSIDGQVQRTKFRNETYNSTSGQYHFPQTPARIQLSLWPAGLAKNGQGTIDWAGGLVDWNSPYMTNGYYYAMVNDVSVDCYDPPAGYKNQGSKSYKYTTTYGTNDTVAITNDNTILSSFYASGDNPSYDPNAKSSSTAKASGTKTASASAAASTSVMPETVPGVSGVGGHSDDSASSNQQANAVSSASGSSATSDSSSGSSSGGSNSFSQGSPSDGTSAGARVAAGSLVALLGFFTAAMML